MSDILLLSQETIDKIAAGEVVERPASVVKELVENAIDAKASIITIEIKKGGVSKIRVSDNGIGIMSNQVSKAFLRHSTSKIRDVSDLSYLKSLGFRGEALSSIAAVSQVELITKTKEDVLGTRYVIEGGVEKSIEEIGAPNGTTFIVRNLFYNTLPRQKFLKSDKTESNYIHDIVEKLALSHPEIAFQLSIDGKTKVSTVGSSKLKDSIYQIFGKTITSNLLEINNSNGDYKIHGFIGDSVISKGNRSFEITFINDRFVKSKILCSAIEEGYKGYLMQHQYPFCVLFVEVDTNVIDVNVHPTKLEVRIDEPKVLSDLITESIYNALNGVEDIREETIEYTSTYNDSIEESLNREPLINDHLIEEPSIKELPIKEPSIIEPYEERKYEEVKQKTTDAINEIVKEKEAKEVEKYNQLSFLSEEAKKNHRIIGQLFDTYWLVEFDDSLYIIDQHAAHEKVLYEKTLKLLKEKEMSSQTISPPVVVTLSSKEETFLNDNIDAFIDLGYKIEHFGGKEYAISAIPYNIFGIDEKAMFLNMIAECSDINKAKSPQIMLEKIASMSCKAAVKGNMRLSYEESCELIDDLMKLDNPFHCPHGRPTIIKMTKQELEKKFKRIV
ncbi:MAG: DNA mismatch repair endonuclease MutL [Lachnospiraceae bacterium]|nr:DNA mismatch repair endonuclease MutL [Lachnospiraceae bacterium]